MNEKTKLEAMYYHTRDVKHIEFLKSHELYAWFRTINTFHGGKIIVEGQTMPAWVDVRGGRQ